MRVVAIAPAAAYALTNGFHVRTIDKRIFPLTQMDSAASHAASTAVIFGSSVVGAPVSTTQVVASSGVGVGGGRRRWGHVRWQVVRDMLRAWFTTIPAAAVLAVLYLFVFKEVAG